MCSWQMNDDDDDDTALYLLILLCDKGDKKLSYRRDSARRRSLRRSRSFKITDVSTNRKLLCDYSY